MNRFAKAFATAGILVASMLGANTAQAVGTTPTVVSITSSPSTGTFVVGDTVTITLNFSEAVDIHGWLALTLETGPTDRTIFCTNCGNSIPNVNSASFSYTVQVGDRSPDLDYQGTGAILFNQAGENVTAHIGSAVANLTLPSPGSIGSLSRNANLIIDGSGEGEQWQSPHSSVAGLHSLVLQEDLRQNVSQLYSANNNWSQYRLCSATIMNAQISSGIATIKTASPHGFQNNEYITVAHMLNSSYNGTFQISNASGFTFSYALNGSPANSSSTHVASGIASRDCSSGNVWYQAVLKSCASPQDADCIEGVYASSTSIPEQAATFHQSFPARGAIDFDSPSSGLPSGGPSSLFTFANFPHAFGSDYAVTVTLSGWKDSTGYTSSPSFFASITPVSIQNTKCDVRYNDRNQDGYCLDSSDGGVAVDQDGGYRCIIWDSNESNSDNDSMVTYGDGNGDVSSCALKHAFPSGVEFKIKARLSNAPSGWFHGRMSNPEISLNTISGVTNVSVSATPVGVPTVGASGPYSNLSQPIKDWFTQNCSQQPVNCGTRMPNQDWSNALTRNALMSPYPYSETSFSQLEMWKSFYDDSAGAISSNWNVRTLESGEMSNASKCITDATGVSGIVTTNSTLYSQGPPTYNESTGTLDYKVASPHLKSDGSSEFLGDYHLLVREDVANCLYKFSGSEVTSTISVQAADGSAKTATTSLTKENGFYNFAATGFTFSTPTIKAKLQAVQAASAPAAESKAPAVTVPAVTVPAVTVPAVTVPVIAVPVMTPKVGTPVIVSNPPAAQVAAGLGMSAEKTVVRTAIKVPALVKGVGIKSYQVLLRSSTGKIVALQTIPNPVAGAVKSSKLTAPASGNYKIEIVATTTKGVKLPKWTSPSIRLKK